MTQPQCYYCGKFLAVNPETMGTEWDVRSIYTYYPTPEPSHDEFWHIKCKPSPTQAIESQKEDNHGKEKELLRTNG